MRHAEYLSSPLARGSSRLGPEGRDAHEIPLPGKRIKMPISVGRDDGEYRRRARDLLVHHPERIRDVDEKPDLL